jgi:hypothetical protein
VCVEKSVKLYRERPAAGGGIYDFVAKGSYDDVPDGVTRIEQPYPSTPARSSSQKDRLPRYKRFWSMTTYTPEEIELVPNASTSTWSPRTRRAW